jgi:carbonic anhydrase
MCSGQAPELDEKTNFVGRWMDILRPGFERVSGIEDDAERMAALEKQAVLVSLENLMTFPFVKEAVDEERLTLHGLWTEIGEGTLENYDAASGKFVVV